MGTEKEVPDIVKRAPVPGEEILLVVPPSLFSWEAISATTEFMTPDNLGIQDVPSKGISIHAVP